MPKFSGLRAMDLLHERGLDIPFILVSGTVGEETAVEAMKHGITDYLLKDRIGRLGNAVERALDQKQLRAERQRMEQQLALQAAALASAANAIIITDATGTIRWANPAFTNLTGYVLEEAIGKTPRILKSGRHDLAFYKNLWRTITSGATWRGEFINRRKDGSLFYDEHTITPVRADGSRITHFIGVMHDVTERRRAEFDLEQTHNQLLAVSRQAGMAELATSILHNIGNALNSVNTAAACLEASLKKSEADRLFKLVALLREHEGDLVAFFTSCILSVARLGVLAAGAAALFGPATVFLLTAFTRRLSVGRTCFVVRLRVLATAR
jgi:PAS domain S-box-containing protein